MNERPPVDPLREALHRGVDEPLADTTLNENVRRSRVHAAVDAALASSAAPRPEGPNHDGHTPHDPPTYLYDAALTVVSTYRGGTGAPTEAILSARALAVARLEAVLHDMERPAAAPRPEGLAALELSDPVFALAHWMTKRLAEDEPVVTVWGLIRPALRAALDASPAAPRPEGLRITPVGFVPVQLYSGGVLPDGTTNTEPIDFLNPPPLSDTGDTPEGAS